MTTTTTRAPANAADVAAPPAYYAATLADGTPIQVWDVIDAYGLDEHYHLGDALAYLLRAHRKGDFAGDLRKARAHILRHDSRDKGEPFALDPEIEAGPMSPAAVAAAYGCEGAQAEAVRMLLETALYRYDDEIDTDGVARSIFAAIIEEIDVALLGAAGSGA